MPLPALSSTRGDAGLDPGRFVSGLASVLKRRGVRLACNTAVLDARMRSGQVRGLLTSRGEIQTEQVVVAAGSWSPALAAKCGCRIPIQPAKGLQCDGAHAAAGVAAADAAGREACGGGADGRFACG